MKASELIGPALDWAVEAAKEAEFKEGRVIKICRFEPTTPAWIEVENYPGSAPRYHRSSPSTDWSQGGPIIEREQIGIDWVVGYTDNWVATSDSWDNTYAGPTPLIATMRCYVASKLGDEVEIPKELL